MEEKLSIFTTQNITQIHRPHGLQNATSWFDTEHLPCMHQLYKQWPWAKRFFLRFLRRTIRPYTTVWKILVYKHRTVKIFLYHWNIG
jgi:hypothetical protein